MKIFFTVLLTALVGVSLGQTRRVTFKIFAKDSVNLHMDENYALIEDTCSTVIRYGHFRRQDRKFFGSFRDLNKYDPSIVLAEGKYTDDGKLDGLFKMHYLNGDPQAEGSFDKGKMTGPWVLYYQGNKRKLEFENNSDQTKIINAWDATGKQTVVNGAGTYRSDLDMLFWEGKLANGRPDGVWRAKKTDDRTGTVITSETFKNGLFVKGSNPVGNYTDKSRIILAGDDLLPINNANLLRTSAQACDPSMSRKKVVYAVYKEGKNAFNEMLKNEIVPVFAKVDLQMYAYKTFEIKGSIDPKGRLTGFSYMDGWEDRQASALLQALYRLPYWEPALVDGQPVASGIVFTFKIDKALYTYSWKLTPIK